MNFQTYSDWKFSSEKLNNNLGYIHGYIVLTCKQFKIEHDIIDVD